MPGTMHNNKPFNTTLFTRTHEWISYTGEKNMWAVGITEYAQQCLGKVVYYELTTSAGSVVKQGEPFAIVESIKAASDVYAPASGTILEVNTELAGSPGKINARPATSNWMIKIDVEDMSKEDLLDENQYISMTKQSDGA